MKQARAALRSRCVNSHAHANVLIWYEENDDDGSVITPNRVQLYCRYNDRSLGYEI